MALRSAGNGWEDPNFGLTLRQVYVEVEIDEVCDAGVRPKRIRKSDLGPKLMESLAVSAVNSINLSLPPPDEPFEGRFGQGFLGYSQEVAPNS